MAILSSENFNLLVSGESSENEAACPGRWQGAQFRKRIGAMSLLNVHALGPEFPAAAKEKCGELAALIRSHAQRNSRRVFIISASLTYESPNRN